RLGSQVLMNEVDSSAILWPYAIACTCLIEGLSDERRGQFAQAGRLEAGFLRAREHGQIGKETGHAHTRDRGRWRNGAIDRTNAQIRELQRFYDGPRRGGHRSRQAI